jgi:hypothetical protein
MLVRVRGYLAANSIHVLLPSRTSAMEGLRHRGPEHIGITSSACVLNTMAGILVASDDIRRDKVCIRLL